MAQAEPSPKMGQSEPAFLMVEQSCGLDQPQVPATLTMCGGFDSLSQQRKGNAAPQPVVEEPPSAALQGLLDIDQILGVDVGQPESSLTLPTEEGGHRGGQRSPWTGSEILNPSSSVGYGVDLGGAGMEAFGQVDLSALLDG
jgi:hypothetical protein